MTLAPEPLPVSDDEADPTAPPPLSPADPEWLTFEKDVRDVLATRDPAAKVEHNVKRVGKSGRLRQIDTLVTGQVGGEKIEIGVEAKRYKGKVGIGVVDALVGKCLDTSVDKGVLYSRNGFDKGAIARAEVADHPKIVLRELPELLPAWSEIVDDFLGVESCPVNECYGQVWVRDDLGWSGGICDHCGTPCGYCEECGGMSALLDDDQACDNCDMGSFEVTRTDDCQNLTEIQWVSMLARDHEDLIRTAESKRAKSHSDFSGTTQLKTTSM